MKKKVAVITGASRGIGRAIGIKYAQKGYHVAICCKSQKDKLRQTAKEITSLGAECITFVGDMGNDKNVERFFQAVHSQYGQIDVLVNNAGVSRMGLLQDMTPEEWDKILTANLRSMLHSTKGLQTMPLCVFAKLILPYPFSAVPVRGVASVIQATSFWFRNRPILRLASWSARYRPTIFSTMRS